MQILEPEFGMALLCTLYIIYGRLSRRVDLVIVGGVEESIERVVFVGWVEREWGADVEICNR